MLSAYRLTRNDHTLHFIEFTNFHCYLNDTEYFDLSEQAARLRSDENKLPPDQNKGITH